MQKLEKICGLSTLLSDKDAITDTTDLTICKVVAVEYADDAKCSLAETLDINISNYSQLYIFLQ